MEKLAIKLVVAVPSRTTEYVASGRLACALKGDSTRVPKSVMSVPVNNEMLAFMHRWNDIRIAITDAQLYDR